MKNSIPINSYQLSQSVLNSGLNKLDIKGGRTCCHRLQNEQIYLPQNAYFYKIVPEAADLIFAEAVDL